ncbi:hypothetical protein [Streptomyces sp. NPDC055992]|uniref:hypothetical protein n=1 Tax=Streptomyces sp. NPDC055992 TaxID=3345673 RepID=UPI0035D77536
MSARRWTTGISAPEGTGPALVAGPGRSFPEAGVGGGPPSDGRTADAPDGAAPPPATGAGTPDDGTADTVRGAAFAGRRAMISGDAVRRARTGAGGDCGDAGAPASPGARRADPDTARTTRLGAVPVGAEPVPVPLSTGAEGVSSPAARSTSGAPPEGALRGVTGVRVTPCTSPTGADGSTAWPRSPSV